MIGVTHSECAKKIWPMIQSYFNTFHWKIVFFLAFLRKPFSNYSFSSWLGVAFQMFIIWFKMIWPRTDLILKFLNDEKFSSIEISITQFFYYSNFFIIQMSGISSKYHSFLCGQNMEMYNSSYWYPIFILRSNKCTCASEIQNEYLLDAI